MKLVFDIDDLLDAASESLLVRDSMESLGVKNWNTKFTFDDGGSVNGFEVESDDPKRSE